jgi:hypothetical protein
MEEKLYLVETVSVFRQRYVVSAREAEHAADEVVMNTTGGFSDEFQEFSQKHLDEIISSVREISSDEYIKIFDEDNDYLKNWDDVSKMQMINVIKYGDKNGNKEANKEN